LDINNDHLDALLHKNHTSYCRELKLIACSCWGNLVISYERASIVVSKFYFVLKFHVWCASPKHLSFFFFLILQLNPQP